MAWHNSYDPYMSWNNGVRVIQVVEQWCRTDNGNLHIISKTRLQPGQHNLYDPYDPYRLWNNGSRVVQLVNCIDVYMLMINNSVKLIGPVNGSRDKHAKDNVCPKAQNTMNILCSQIGEPNSAIYIYWAFRSPKAGESKSILHSKNVMNILRSQSVKYH